MGGANSKLNPEAVAELQKKTYFDRKEIQLWYRSFIRECPSGVLQKQDLLQMYRQFFPFGDPTAYVDQVFRLLDTRGDGVIDFAEYLGALSVCSRGRLEERIQWAFRLYDLNNDGSVGWEEMLVVVEAIYQMMGDMLVDLPPDEQSPVKRVAKIFRLLNKEPDAFINLDEFRETAHADPMIVQGLLMYDGIV